MIRHPARTLVCAFLALVLCTAVVVSGAGARSKAAGAPRSGARAQSRPRSRASSSTRRATFKVATSLVVWGWRHPGVRCYIVGRSRLPTRWRCNWSARLSPRAGGLRCRGAIIVSRRRWSLISLGAVCAKATATGAAGSSLATRPQTKSPTSRKKPSITSTPGPPPTPTPPSGSAGFGFNDNAVGQGLISATRDAQLEHEVGSSVERSTFDWRWVEAKQGQYNFATYDQLYAAERARGIRPLWILLAAPSWASAVRCDQFSQNCLNPPSPAHYADAAKMAALIATRYPDSAGIEIWNEPNLHWFWPPAPDPVAYGDLLKVSYAAVKQANPSMPVVLGGLSNVQTAATNGDIPLSDYLTSLYAHGARSSMDAIGFHPYPAGASLALTNSVIADVRAIRHRFGDDGRALWATEIGLTTNGWWQINDQQQAITLTRAYAELSAMPDVRMIIFHTLIESGSSSDPEFGYGLMTPDLRPRPAFCAFAALRKTGFNCG